MGITEKLITLKITSAVALDGVIIKAGQLVEMVESEAKDLLRRGKAELHAIMEDAGLEAADDAAAALASAEAIQGEQQDAESEQEAAADDAAKTSTNRRKK